MIVTCSECDLKQELDDLEEAILKYNWELKGDGYICPYCTGKITEKEPDDIKEETIELPQDKQDNQ